MAQKQKLIAMDGASAKSINPWDVDSYPDAWTSFSGQPKTPEQEMLSRVSAAFRAFNLKANTVASVPFTLFKGNQEYDNSNDWENKVKFLPNPQELLRLDTLSLMASNTFYNLATSNRLGYPIKGLYNAIFSSFYPQTNVASMQLEYIERRIGTQAERYAPDGVQIMGDAPKTKLIYAWRLDHTTEVLPSLSTEAKAIMSSAGIIANQDAWVEHFYRRGGIKATLIGMKGLVNTDTAEESEKKWSNWLKGIGKWFGRPAAVYNTESIDVKPVGSGVDDMKDNKIYEQAIANIAMGTGMPLSLLLANSANYATAQEEKATWYENDIIPLCRWIAYEYNRQLWEPLGFYMEFQPQTLDPNQQDETEKADAVSQYIDIIVKCPTYDLFIGMADTIGIEISDTLDKALVKYYADKKAKQEAGVLDANGQPVEVQPVDKEDEEDEPVEEVPAKSIKANETSAMIALRIPNAIREEIRARYAFVDEETLNNLHITLVYLGDNRTLDKMDAVRAVSDFGMYQSPIKGRLQGLARFVNGQETDPLVVTFDSPQMPVVYETLCDILDNYHVPYHRTHGFIPHMTLAYIASDAEMPIETIEPIEINFSDVYLVDGNVWLPAEFTGMENKTAKTGASKWIPGIDEQNELRVWAEVALRRLKKGEPLDFKYESHYAGLPVDVSDKIAAQLKALETPTPESIKAIFDGARMTEMLFAPQVKENSEIMALAAAMNKLADANLSHRESDKE